MYHVAAAMYRVETAVRIGLTNTPPVQAMPMSGCCQIEKLLNRKR